MVNLVESGSVRGWWRERGIECNFRGCDLGDCWGDSEFFVGYNVFEGLRGI